MTKNQAIQLHERLVLQRAALVKQLNEVESGKRDEHPLNARLRELDLNISRYGQAHNSCIARKAALAIGLETATN